MELLVLDQATFWPGNLQTKGRASWVQSQWDKETPEAVALTTLSRGPQPLSILSWGNHMTPQMERGDKGASYDKIRKERH